MASVRIYYRDRLGRFRAPTAIEKLQELGVGGGGYIPEHGGGGRSVHIEYLIGSDLPYASYWIEAGHRFDPRSGRDIEVDYAQPNAIRFLENAELYLASAVEAHPITEEEIFVGVRFESWMHDRAEDIVDGMRDRLDKILYSRPAYNPRTRKRWDRQWRDGHSLWNSIRAMRTS